MSAVIRFLATGFYFGYSPIMPGTAGSLPALLIAWLISLEFWHIILLCFIGVWICGCAETIFGEPDSPKIVFDEFCGVFIATWQLEQGYLFILAFILFRLFDIIKPFPINKLQVLPGGWGIMADDLAAGLAVRLILFFVSKQ